MSGGRRLALIIASALTALAVVAVVWSAVWMNSGGSTNTNANAPAPPMPTLFPDGVVSGDAGNPSPTIQDLVSGPMQESERGRLDFVDADGAVVRTMLYERLVPQEGGRILVTKPEAWMRLRSGAVAHLLAERGSLVQPAGRREPESGRFEGDVRIRIHPTDPRTQTDADAAPSAMLLKTDSLNFDLTMGEFRTNDFVQITGDGVDVSFTGFTLLLDEAQSRLTLFRTDSPGKAIFDPAAMASRSSSNSERDEDRDSADQFSDAAADVIETLYQATMTGDVRILSGARRATAERLDLWTRLHNGRITARTAAGLDSIRASASGPPANEASSPPQATGAPQEHAPTNADSTGSTDSITLSWSSGVVVAPMKATPAELDHEDALARLSSPVRGAVELADDGAGLSSRSVGVDFAVATQYVTWSGLGPRSVLVRSDNVFETTTGRLELDLASAVASFPGPGALRSLAPLPLADPIRPETPRQVTWLDHADITLARTATGVDFRASPMLTRALFVGVVEAHDASSNMAGDQLQTFFSLDHMGNTAISRAIVTGSARVDSATDGTLTASRLDIEFDMTDSAGASPSVATAQGDVRATRQGSTIRADLAETRFRRDVNGELVVETFGADLGVVVQTVDGVETRSNSLRARPETGVVDLTGAPARITLGGSVIAGDSVQINQNLRTLTIFGPGTLDRAALDVELGYENLHLAWTDSMRYDDLAGIADFLGGCELTADRSALGRDLVTAARMRITTTPFAERRNGADQNPSILTASAFGAVEESDTTSLAHVESRRYAHDETAPDGLRLTRLLSLDGPTITTNVKRDELVVPMAGRLLIENRPDRPEGSGSPTLSTGRGTTLIEWIDSFTLRRGAGSADFRRQVRTRHRPLGAAMVTELECERLELAFDPDMDAQASADNSGLLWAQAGGAVYVAQGRRQVIADRLLYDNTLGYAELTAWPGNLVTLFDAATPTPLTGELLRWDLLRDRVEWRGARPTAAPD